jgi:RsiW-degrading membrane proteinase PrsW (M82 family)
VELAELIVPVVPALLWLWVIYRADSYQPEPKRLVAFTFLLGVLCAIPAFALERLGDRIYPFLGEIERASWSIKGVPVKLLPMALGCFFVIGPAEELCKFLAVRVFSYRRPEFDEPMDGIVYASAAALGFASVENLLYVLDFDTWRIRWGMLGLRAFLSLPGHVLFSAWWGYALGRRRFNRDYRVWPLWLAAAGLHGLYDFVLMVPSLRPAIALCMALMVPVLVRQIRALRADSPFAPDAALVPESRHELGAQPPPRAEEP